VVTFSVFVAVAIGVVVSPRFRRYIRRQYPGGSLREDPDVIGKYTILEDELDEIRDACLAAVVAARPTTMLKQWRGRRWDAITDGLASGFTFAVLPGMFSDHDLTERVQRETGGESEIAIELCVVAIWKGRAWQPSAMLFPGNEQEALVQLKKVIEENRPAGGAVAI
jgi:hypothetical protein